MKGDEWAHFKDKGRRASLAMWWLLHAEQQKDCNNPHLASMLWAAEHRIGVLASSPLFLTKAEGQQVNAWENFLII